MIAETTLSSYETNIRPKLGILESEIRRLLRTHPSGMTNKEIAQLLRKDASTVSGIVRPLVVRNQVYEAGTRVCSVTGNRAKVWRLASQREEERIPAIPPDAGPHPTAPLFPDSVKVANRTYRNITWL